MLRRQDRHEIHCALLSQWIVAIIFSLVMWVFVSKAAAWSSVYGAVVSIFPTMVFTGVLFRYQGARHAKQIVRSLYVGEGLKLFLTALLFGGCICFLHPHWGVLFVSFILVHMSLCLNPLFFVCEPRS